MGEKIKIGVIGCTVGRYWVAGARSSKETTALAIADLNQDVARQVAEEYNVARVYRDYRELLADDEIDGVAIATSPDIRKQMVIDALKAGKHVLSQKPHACNTAGVKEMNDVAEATRKTLVYSYFMRHQQENKDNRAIITGGAIGSVYHARVHYHYRERGVDYEPPPSRNWLYQWGLKGGALGQHGSHYLDLAWFLMGSPQPEWAFAVSHNAFPTILSVDRHSEDYLSFLVGFAGDITLQMDTSSVIPTWADRAWDLRLRILGKQGTIELESSSQASRRKRSGTRRLLHAIYTEGEDFTDEFVQHSDGDFNAEIRDFAGVIRGTQLPDVSPADALTFMKLMDAIYLSAETGEKVQIEK